MSDFHIHVRFDSRPQRPAAAVNEVDEDRRTEGCPTADFMDVNERSCVDLAKSGVVCICRAGRAARVARAAIVVQ